MTRTREENARDEMNASAQRASVVSAIVEGRTVSGMILNRFMDSDQDLDTFMESLMGDPLPGTTVDAEDGFITFNGTTFDAAIFCAGVEERYRQVRDERNGEILNAFGEPDFITGEGYSWHIIRSKEAAKVAGSYGHTAVATYWGELEYGSENKGRVWAVMFDETSRAMITMAALSKSAQGQSSSWIADCHVTGFCNKNSFEDYRAEIEEFCDVMDLVVYPNHMGVQLDLDDTPEP